MLDSLNEIDSSLMRFSLFKGSRLTIGCEGEGFSIDIFNLKVTRVNQIQLEILLSVKGNQNWVLPCEMSNMNRVVANVR